MLKKKDQSNNVAASPKPATIGKGTVIVIDDEEVVRSACAAILNHAGYRVISAQDGREGLELFEQLESETICVLLDLSMPYLRGNVVYARLKAINPDIPVLVMSGYCDEQIMRDFSAAGVSGFVHKPFQPETLVSSVRSLKSAQSNVREAVRA
jgi:FixJ family two-component response regulator